MALHLLVELVIALLGSRFFSLFHWTEADRLIEVNLTLSIVIFVTIIGHSDLDVFSWCLIFRINCADTEVLRSTSFLFW